MSILKLVQSLFGMFVQAKDLFTVSKHEKKNPTRYDQKVLGLVLRNTQE